MSAVQTELAHPGSLPTFSEAGLPVSEIAVSPAAQSPIRAPTTAEWTAAALSLLIHLVAMLVLLALLVPIQRLGTGSSIDGGLGTEEGDGELVNSVTIGSPAPGKGEDLEKTATPTVDGVPAVEGALARGGSGSGIGSGRFDAIAALGTGGGGTGKGIGFFGTRTRADSVVFVVDMSGSMQDGQPSRFKRAVDELVHSLNAMQPTQRFFIFFYNGATFPLFDQSAAKLVAATPAMRTKAIKWIKTMQPNGDTAPEDAIQRALKLKPQVVYFLTDGEIPDTTRDTAKKWNNDRKTVIHTIAFESEAGAEILRGIALDSRGKYRFVR